MKRRYAIKITQNIIRALLLVILTSMVAFALMKASPVDPLQANVGQAALGSMSQEQIEKLREYWGVGTSPVRQYLSWAADFATGDMGTSLLYRQPVKDVIAVKLSNSLFLMALAWVISGILGFALGAVAGMNEGRLIDKGIKGYCLLISSTPTFWLALLLLVVFGVWLKILPIGLSVPIGVEASGVTFMDRVYHAILPAVTLSITGVSNIALHTINSCHLLFLTCNILVYVFWRDRIKREQDFSFVQFSFFRQLDCHIDEIVRMEQHIRGNRGFECAAFF